MTPPPRLVPDRPSDAVRAKLQRIREAGQALGKLLGDGQPHSDFLATVVGQSSLAIALIDAAAPPAEAPAERGPLASIVECVLHKTYMEHEDSKVTTTLLHDMARAVATALPALAAAPAGEADTLNAGRLKALQRGLAIARKWASDGSAGETGTYFADSLIRKMGEQMREALSSKPGDYDAAPAAPAPVHTWLNHEAEPHCIGCYVIDGRSLIATCNECGHAVDVRAALCGALGASPPAAPAPDTAGVPEFVMCRCYDDTAKRLCADRARCLRAVAQSQAPRVTGGRDSKRCGACEGTGVLPHNGSECPFCDVIRTIQAATGGAANG